MPSISVIIPVFDVEKYIRRCIDSVLNQSFTDYEIILVDDGSPDNSPQICDEYAKRDNRIHVIHKENGGLSSARNAGIGKATGKYLFFLDSDDLIHPECFRVLLDCARKENAEIVVGEFTRFKEESVISFPEEGWNGKYQCYTNIETLNEFFESRPSMHSIVSACGTLWDAELFNGIRFPVGRLFEDEFMTYKLYYKANKTVFVDFTVYYYYVNEKGITGTLTLEKKYDEYDAQWERLLFFDEHGLSDLAGKAALHFLKTAQWDLIALRNKNKQEKTPRSQTFEQQFKQSLLYAKKSGASRFLRDFDYYVLAMPEKKLYWRIKRIIMVYCLHQSV